MIKEFVNKWDKNKINLEKYFRETKQQEYSDYVEIVKALFREVINKEEEFESNTFDVDNIEVIDDGDWQGTQIFILHKNTYQPNVGDYVYTNTYYGSCSGCDTLQAIQGLGLPDEGQVKDYMSLSLSLLQKCKYMQDEED